MPAYILLCGNCYFDEFDTPNPDESICVSCGKVHEKLEDYHREEVVK